MAKKSLETMAWAVSAVGLPADLPGAPIDGWVLLGIP